MECAAARNDKVVIKQKILDLLNKDLDEDKKLYDIPTWFDHSQVDDGHLYFQFDPMLGTMGFIPVQLEKFLKANNIKNVNKVMSTIQLLILQSLYNRFNNRTK